MHRILFVAAVLCAATSLPAFGAELGPGINPVACEDQPWSPRDPAFAALPGARVFFGTYSGGLYHVEIPEAWNGELVLWAHGFVAADAEGGKQLRVATPSLPAFREHLLKQGFAWAASSYRCNGYVPGIGLLDTIALKEVFTKANAGKAPSRTYLTGASMGGHVTVLGLQEFPNEFDGGLATCAAGPGEFNYLTGAGEGFEAIAGVKLADIAKEKGTARLDQLLGKGPEFTQLGRQMASVQIAISGGPRPFAMDGLNDRLSGNIRSAAGFPTNYAYSAWAPFLSTADLRFSIDEKLGFTTDALNARIQRKIADPRARQSARYEESMPFDGKLTEPLLTLHGLGDMFVPVSLERELKRAVDTAGASALLVQRLVRAGGHCTFSAPEMIRAFDDLVRWVRQGQRPEGDDVFQDFRDAGKKFTDPIRPGDPGGLQP